MRIMIIAAASDTPTPTNLLVFIALIGVAGVWFGARLVFNVRGAVDVALARRRVALELRAQQSGNLSSIETQGLEPSYFRTVGIVISGAGVLLLLVDAIIATH